VGTKVVGGVAVDLIARTAKWRDGFNQAKREANSFRSAMDSTLHRIVGWAAVYKSIQYVGNKFNEQREAIERLGDTADRLNMTTKSLQGFQLAAAKANLSAEELTQGLTYMTRNIGEAMSGNTAMADAFRRIGISVQSIAKLSPDEQFGAIADGINKLQTAAAKTSVTMDIFGRSGANMMTLISEGSGGIEFNKKRIEDLGLAIDKNGIDAVKRMNDSVEEAKALWNGLWSDATIALAKLTNGAKEVYDTLAPTGAHTASDEWFRQKYGGAAAGPEYTTQSDINNTLAKQQEALRVQQQEAADLFGSLKRKEAEAGYAALDEFTTQEEAKREQILKTSEALKAAHELETEALKAAAKARANALRQTVSTFSSMTSSLAQNSEEWFRINKLAAIAETTINTIDAMTVAMTLGPVLGPIAATAIGIAGAANIAAIRATTFEGGGTIPGASSATATTTEGAGATRMQSINIIMKGSGRYSRDEVIGLMEEMGAAMSDGYRLNVSGG